MLPGINERGSIGVDKFVVPAYAREEFLDRGSVRRLLLSGGLNLVCADAILEQGSGPGEFDFVTIVEWQNGDAVEGARKAVVAIHQGMILMRGR
jgi:hypothetical protein